ncbi:MAG: chorismate synthase [Cellulomonadaceae bacterium]|nr:chorismate synthase [Cellulomonadaceae bacterium]
MLRWMTAGESHGEALIAVLEGLPAGVDLTTSDITAALARRRLGYGRGARMAFEQDQVRVLGGLRQGVTQGSPLAMEIANTEWPKWKNVMGADPAAESPAAESAAAQAHDADQGKGDPQEIARNKPLTRPRPGHADLAGLTKYGFTETRPVLERASARETASRVALGAAASAFLNQAAGIRLVSHVTAIGSVEAPPHTPAPAPSDVPSLDASPVRCHNAETATAMVAEIDAAKKDGDTLGGVVEVLAYGVPPGLGSYVAAHRRLDARIAGALMSIQAIKGVEIGDGFTTATRRGSQAHDEIVKDAHGVHRATNRAGGIEGGMSNGEPLRVRAAMKPIATVPRALRTIDVTTGEPAQANHQRSDVCAVPAAAVIAEAEVALILADAVLEKFGGDHVKETARSMKFYLESIPEAIR